jgi:Ca2+-binding RTX toxin-like protein
MAPVNDNFPGIRVTTTPFTDANATVRGATGQPGEPSNTNSPGPIQSIWYNWTAPTAGEYAVHTVGSPINTTLGVYTGNSVNALTKIGSNDNLFNNFLVPPPNPDVLLRGASGLTFNATSGQNYKFSVDAVFPVNGPVVFNLVKVNRGTIGNDNLNGTNATDWIEGGAGDDNINGNGGYDVLSGGNGNDNINGGSLSDYLDGGNGSDRINGNGGNDTIFGGAGNDTIAGGSSDDYIDGGRGNDVIFSNGGNDTLLGGDGNDVIYGSSSNDLISAGAGNDTIFSNGGEDLIATGDGLDTVWLGGGFVTIILETGAGFDTINNFQLGQTRFQLGFPLSSTSNLTFTDSAQGVRISAGNDLLAVVSGNQASTFEANPSQLF